MDKNSKFQNYPAIPSCINEPHMLVILLLDISGSFYGIPISILNATVNRYIASIAEDPVAGNLVDLCIIAFNGKPTVVQNWRPANTAEPVSLEAGGTTNLSDALELAVSMLQERGHLYEDVGIDVKMPYIILVTDGYGNDITDVAEVIKKRTDEHKMKLWTLCVKGYDKATIAKLTEGKRVFELVDENSFDFSEFFDFMAASTKAVSTCAPGIDRVIVNHNIGSEGSTCRVPDLVAWLNN